MEGLSTQQYNGARKLNQLDKMLGVGNHIPLKLEIIILQGPSSSREKKMNGRMTTHSEVDLILFYTIIV